MTWLESTHGDPSAPGIRLAAMLERPGILGAPGAHDALSGLLARKAGFQALYVSGAALSASRGLPDLGILTLDELVSHTRVLFRATDLPLIVDADTGYGEALNVMRVVKELEAAGAAAMHIEDQRLPKKCGHLSDKRLVPAGEMAAKVAAAVAARTHLRIIARTDAAADSFEDAVARGRRYLAAGADVIFADALGSEAELRAFAKAVPAPLLVNMTEFGRTPHFTAQQFQDFGYKIVIWPASSLRVAAKAVEALYAHIGRHGGTEGHVPHMQTRADLYETIGYHDYEALDTTIAKSVLPDAGR